MQLRSNQSLEPRIGGVASECTGGRIDSPAPGAETNTSQSRSEGRAVSCSQSHGPAPFKTVCLFIFTQQKLEWVHVAEPGAD